MECNNYLVHLVKNDPWIILLSFLIINQLLKLKIPSCHGSWGNKKNQRSIITEKYRAQHRMLLLC